MTYGTRDGTRKEVSRRETLIRTRTRSFFLTTFVPFFIALSHLPLFFFRPRPRFIRIRLKICARRWKKSRGGALAAEEENEAEGNAK